MPAEPVAMAPETRAAIDRRALVRRHNPTLHRPEPGSPLTVGNGEFAFTADVTGLQSLDDAGAPVPLCTQAQWGWHRSPRPPAVGAAVYLPGNGAVLIAVALMAGGWRGSRGPAPGFPADGTWTVRAEGLRPWL